MEPKNPQAIQRQPLYLNPPRVESRAFFLTLLTVCVTAGNGIKLWPKAETPHCGSHVRITWDAFKATHVQPSPTPHNSDWGYLVTCLGLSGVSACVHSFKPGPTKV